MGDPRVGDGRPPRARGRDRGGHRDRSSSPRAWASPVRTREAETGAARREAHDPPEPDSQDPRGVAFYFDLGSPYAYLSAERISRLFADAGLAQPEWKPILLGALFARCERGSWSLTDARETGMREVERRAGVRGIQPIRWPDPFPANTLYAMRVATYAKSIGRAVSFALAAFRQAFAGGRDLTDPDNVAIAAAACELHPNAVARAAASESVKARLREQTGQAGDRGVFGVPTVAVGEEVFWGDDRLEDAVAAAARLD
ncbi:MAG: 2-hydroxychromene-2-carboxylate isomerase [Thermoleophilia bacterium]|nr:2-hydroxychromene-2-carboxylate isomerase [Thermoleophilia bacterium]